MARFHFNSYPLRAYGERSYTVNMAIGRDDEFAVTVEAKNVKELIPLFDTWARQVEAHGKPLLLSTRIARGDRKPPGFDAATSEQRSENPPLRRFVNTDKCPEKAFA